MRRRPSQPKAYTTRVRTPRAASMRPPRIARTRFGGR